MDANLGDIGRLAGNARRYCSGLLDLLYEQYKVSWNVARSPLLTGREGEKMRVYLTDVSLPFLNSLMSAASEIEKTASKIRELAMIPGNSDAHAQADLEIRRMSQDLLDRIGELSVAVGVMRDAGFEEGGSLNAAAIEKISKEFKPTPDYEALLDQWVNDPYLRAQYPLQRREEPWRDVYPPDLLAPFGGSLLPGRYQEQCSKDGIITLTEKSSEEIKPSGKAPEIRMDGVADTARGSGSVQTGTDDMLGYISAADGCLSAIGYYRTAFEDAPDYERQMSFTSHWDNRTPFQGRYLYNGLSVCAQIEPSVPVSAIVDGEVAELTSGLLRLAFAAADPGKPAGRG